MKTVRLSIPVPTAARAIAKIHARRLTAESKARVRHSATSVLVGWIEDGADRQAKADFDEAKAKLAKDSLRAEMALECGCPTTAASVLAGRCTKCGKEIVDNG